jgi:uncharacterized protein (TIGR02145 family)
MKKIFYLSAFLVLYFSRFAAGQSVSILLTFTAQCEQVHTGLDSILIENLTKGTDTLLFGPDTSILIYNSSSGISDDNNLTNKNSLFISNNYPNPFSDRSDFRVSISEPQSINIMVYDVSGRCLATYTNHLTTGDHTFSFYPGKENIYLCLIRGEKTSKGFKMISSGNNEAGVCKIVYNSYDFIPGQIKSFSADDHFGFTPGDQLRYTGFAKTTVSVKGSDVIEDAPQGSKSYTFEIREGLPCPGMPFVSYEGQTYHTVLIGNHCWLKENLNAGKMIGSVHSQHDNDTIEKYCYDDDPLKCDTFGGLYLWRESLNYTDQQQNQGICPHGWHVPSTGDWENLAINLGGCELAGEKLKEAGTSHWISGSNNANSNSSGFSALPGGYRYSEANFDGLGQTGEFWTSTSGAENPNPFWSENLSCSNFSLNYNSGGWNNAYSVRCVLDYPRLPMLNTTAITDISDTSAFAGGWVLNIECSPVIARGVCWNTTGFPTIADPHTTDGVGPGNFTSYIYDLEPELKYYYTAYATNAYGTSYGIIDDFTTVVVGLPVVFTNFIFDVKDTTARCNSSIIDNGHGIIYECGVCWANHHNPDLTDPHSLDDVNNPDFISDLTNLSPGSVYYVRSYARNKAGLSYGTELPLITQSGIQTGIPCPGMPTITYEGQVYNTVFIQSHCWLRENLNVGVQMQGEQDQTDNGIIEKHCYNDQEEMCEKYGGLYQWDEMMQYVESSERGICPEGWHVPNHGFMASFASDLGGQQFAGGKMKETGTAYWSFPNAMADNSTGFSSRAGGNRGAEGNYYNFGSTSYFWTSSQTGIGAMSWYNRYTDGAFNYNLFDINTARSVRCIRD